MKKIDKLMKQSYELNILIYEEQIKELQDKIEETKEHIRLMEIEENSNEPNE